MATSLGFIWWAGGPGLYSLSNDGLLSFKYGESADDGDEDASAAAARSLTGALPGLRLRLPKLVDADVLLEELPGSACLTACLPWREGIAMD